MLIVWIRKQAVKVMIKVELYRERKRLERDVAVDVELLVKDRLV